MAGLNLTLSPVTVSMEKGTLISVNPTPSKICSEFVVVLKITVPMLKLDLSRSSVVNCSVLLGSNSPKFNSNSLTKRLNSSGVTSVLAIGNLVFSSFAFIFYRLI